MSLTPENPERLETHVGMIHPEFESLVQRIIQTVDKENLTELRRDFHARLRITLTQPDRGDLIEDLWDFFYDWCVFEQRLPDSLTNLTPEERKMWDHVKELHTRGLFTIKSASTDSLKIKELFTGKSYLIHKKGNADFLGISRGDFIEVRLVPAEEGEKSKAYCFVRRPSYHPSMVHDYIKKKVKQFKKSKDYASYQSWLWLLVGMYLKHRIYHHMPIDKIYDDNSRI